MDKSPDAFRTISEVADHLDTPAHVLRFWESRFPQIKPVKRAGGRRYYRPSDVALLTGIKRLLHDEGLTIRGVQKILRDHGVRQVAGLTDDSVSLDDLASPEDLPARSPDPDEALATARPAPPLTPAPVLPTRPEEHRQGGLPLFDAPERAVTPAPIGLRRPTRRDDRTFASLIRALAPGTLQAHQPELSGIALRLRALRAQLAARADGSGD